MSKPPTSNWRILAGAPRWAWVMTAVIALSFTCSCASILMALVGNRRRSHSAIAAAWSRFVLRVANVRVEVRGVESLRGGPYVFAVNHASHMDIPVLLASMPCEVRFMAEDRLFWIPIFGHHLRSVGHVSVSRRGTVKRAGSIKAALRILQSGISIIVFPEGGRARMKVGAFHDGAACLAERSGGALVPVTIRGTRTILPFGSANIRSGTAQVIFAPPIDNLLRSRSHWRAVTNQVHEHIAYLADHEDREA